MGCNLFFHVGSHFTKIHFGTPENSAPPGGGGGQPTSGLRERGNDTSKSTGRSGRQKVATRRNMRREERVTVQGPVKEQQPDGMSHRGGSQTHPPTPLNPHPPPTPVFLLPLHVVTLPLRL